jgi:hypothetical protein
MRCLNFLLFFILPSWIRIPYPDPDPISGSGYGTTDLIQSRSRSGTLIQSTLDSVSRLRPNLDMMLMSMLMPRFRVFCCTRFVPYSTWRIPQLFSAFLTGRFDLKRKWLLQFSRNSGEISLSNYPFLTILPFNDNLLPKATFSQFSQIAAVNYAGVVFANLSRKFRKNAK